MSDEVVLAAEALRDSIAKRLAALQAQVRATEADLQQANAMVERAKGAGPVPAGTSAGRNPSRHDVMSAVLEVIAERGKPLKLADLHEGINARGIALSGRDPAGVLSTMLWRGGQDGVLINLKGAGYWDAKRPYPAAGYVPPKGKAA